MASVTVIHPQAQFADAYATTIMVLGVDEGMALAERLNIPVLIVEKSADDTFVERYATPCVLFRRASGVNMDTIIVAFFIMLAWLPPWLLA